MNPAGASQADPQPSEIKVASVPTNEEPNDNEKNSGYPQEAIGTVATRRSAAGPRTLLGKSRSRENATTHGIFSKAVLLRGESQSDYESLLNGLNDSLEPVGSLEELLVEKLATLVWRHRRLVTAEAAEIRKHTEFLEWDKKQERSVDADKQAGETAHVTTPGLSDLLEEKPPLEGLIWHIENPEILDRCLELLTAFREAVERNGLSSESEETSSNLKRIYGPPSQEHLRRSLRHEYELWSATARVSRKEREQNEYASPEKCKEQALGAIDKEIGRLTTFKEQQSEIESKRIEVEKLRQSVPDSPALDRLLRYEAALERAFDRTLSQLERMQRMRKGQAVLPAIKLDVSS